jgi:teichuronic acid exporter
MSLRRDVGVGLFWVAIATVSSKGLALMRKLILARLLVPGDFGLVGYATLAIGVLQLFQELGFSSALIYRKDDAEDAADTTFIVVMTSSLFLYAVGWLSAPLVADFFRNTELTSVLRALSLTLVISAVSQVPLSLMAKGMGFKNQVIPELIAVVVGSALSVVPRRDKACGPSCTGRLPLVPFCRYWCGSFVLGAPPFIFRAASRASFGTMASTWSDSRSWFSLSRT